VQDSTNYGGISSRAVDGNTSGNWVDSSVTATNEGSGTRYWLVDLVDVAVIVEIILYNRVDCCSSRLNNFSLEILDAGETVVDSRFFSSSEFNPIFTQKSFSFDNVQGSKVRISLTSGLLSLAEVEVYE